jgi:hypothetical protein
MRLVCLEEDRLSGLQAADVEDEGAEDSNVSREVAVERLDKLTLRLLKSRLALLVTLDELLDLLRDELIIRLHQRRKELLEAGLLVVLGGGGGGGEFGLEGGRDGGTDNGGEFGDGGEEGGDLSGRTEAAETGEVGEGDGHFGLLKENKVSYEEMETRGCPRGRTLWLGSARKDLCQLKLRKDENDSSAYPCRHPASPSATSARASCLGEPESRAPCR